MSEQRDKFLTEAMGNCYHEGWSYKNVLEGVEYVECCVKCHKSSVTNWDFSTWNGFGKLWEWSQKQGWWEDFSYISWSNAYCQLDCHVTVEDIHPQRFADLVYAFLKEKR